MVPRFVANEDQARFNSGHPLEMQVKRYGSALGFHPRGKGSTPFTRTMPAWSSSHDGRLVSDKRWCDSCRGL